MNIAVLGAGAMRCLFGGRLAEAGHRVVLIDIRRELIEAIDRDGLVPETPPAVRACTTSRLR